MLAADPIDAGLPGWLDTVTVGLLGGAPRGSFLSGGGGPPNDWCGREAGRWCVATAVVGGADGAEWCCE